MQNIRKHTRKKRKAGRILAGCLIVLLVLGIGRWIAQSGAAGFLTSMHRLSEGQKERLRREGCPESLLNLANRNPETLQFVKDYPKKAQNTGKIDISEDMEKLKDGGIPLFLQWDERWGYRTYGSDCMAVTGCGPTCLSMVYCGLTGQPKNPYAVAKRAQNNGYYIDGQGSTWDMMSTMAANMGLTVEDVTFDREHVTKTLQEGSPIICIMGPGDFTASGHFIVLAGVDDDGKLIVNDPNSRKNSRKTWDFDAIRSQIRNLWAYHYEE